MKPLIAFFMVVLLLTVGCTTEGERVRMRSGLDSLNTLNRTDQPFTVQDVEPYVRFFDDHGTSNDRLLAHYLLGRAYYDHGEAPMALQCYHDAIDCADTTAQDCDYAQLARVYGQMAEIFYYQGLFRRQLTFEKQSVKYAWLAKDTLAALMSYEQESFAYSELGLKDSAIFVIEDVIGKYERYGYSSFAAMASGDILHILIDKGALSLARKYMNIFESKSGLFNTKGDIAKGKEFYYSLKGRLYLKESRIDSAEFWFRKEISQLGDYYNQNAAAYGLANVYERKDIPDSAAKYYAYAYAMNDSAFKLMETEKVGNMQLMYDYTHQQRLAQIESKRADRATNLFGMSIALLIIVTLTTYIAISRINQKRQNAIRDYRNSLSEIQQAQYDIARLHEQEISHNELIAEKERIIDILQIEIKKFQTKSSKANHRDLEMRLKESDEYKLFLNYSFRGLKPSDKEWRCMHIKMFELFPDFHNLLIANKHLLNQNEFNACILVRMHFKPSDLMNMLGISSSYSNKIRKTLLQKLFNSVGKAEEFDEKIGAFY